MAPWFDPLEVLWFIIGLVGAFGSGRAVQTANRRFAARGGRNGPRLYLLTARRLTARMHLAAFLLWMVSGIWAIMQPTGETTLRQGLIAALVGGFVIEALAILVTNVRDERLERMLMQPEGSPHRRKHDIND